MNTWQVIKELEPGQRAFCGYWEIRRAYPIEKTLSAGDSTQHMRLRFFLNGMLLNEIPLSVFDIKEWFIESMETDSPFSPRMDP